MPAMKSHPQHPHRFQRAFTLVELLVVIVIIAILAALAVPVTNKVMQNAYTVQIKATMKDIQVAIGHYRTEYNRFPINMAGSTSGNDMDPIITNGSNQFVNILMGMTNPSESPNLNIRKLKFIDLPFAKNGQSFGVIDPSGGAGTGAPLQLVDLWGQPYRVMLDTNYDNRLLNPDASNVDQRISGRAPQFLNATSAIHSTGPDRILNTKDDVVSWR
jgi:prepilin-type N-terminal cleavage/methylation domain-containing protein